MLAFHALPLPFCPSVSRKEYIEQIDSFSLFVSLLRHPAPFFDPPTLPFVLFVAKTNMLRHPTNVYAGSVRSLRLSKTHNTACSSIAREVKPRQNSDTTTVTVNVRQDYRRLSYNEGSTRHGSAESPHHGLLAEVTLPPPSLLPWFGGDPACSVPALKARQYEINACCGMYDHDSTPPDVSAWSVKADNSLSRHDEDACLINGETSD